MDLGQLDVLVKEAIHLKMQEIMNSDVMKDVITSSIMPVLNQTIESYVKAHISDIKGTLIRLEGKISKFTDPNQMKVIEPKSS